VRNAFIGLVLVSVTAQASEAPRILGVRRATIETQTRELVDVEGGAWLSDTQAEAVAHELVRLKAENGQLRKEPCPEPRWGARQWAVLGLGLVLGAGAAVAVTR
jgi:hypothetical protein